MADLLSRIEAELGGDLQPSERAVLLARRACYLARIGSFDDARKDISLLRGQFGDGRSPRISVWIMLAEGVTHTFERLSPEGLDRVARAHALASAMKDRQLIAWTSAWLAHLRLERSEFKGMALGLRHAFDNAEPTEHEALARASMVIANAYMTIEDPDRALGWYMAARFHALEMGDRVTLEALLYNRAVFGIAAARARACLASSDTAALARLRRESFSAKNLQVLIGVNALTNLIGLWDARLALLSGEFQSAIDGFEAVRGSGPFSSRNFHESVLDLEIAYCLSRLGRQGEATERFQRAGTLESDDLHADEQLYLAWLQLQLARQEGTGFGALSSAQERFELVRATYERERAELEAALNELRDYRPPELAITKVLMHGA